MTSNKWFKRWIRNRNALDVIQRGHKVIIIIIIIIIIVGRDGSVGLATRYGLDGPGIESRWGKIFRNHPDRPWGPPSL